MKLRHEIINKICVFTINVQTYDKMHKSLFCFERRNVKIYVDFKIYCFSIPFCIRHHQFSFHFRQCKENVAQEKKETDTACRCIVLKLETVYHKLSKFIFGWRALKAEMWVNDEHWRMKWMKLKNAWRWSYLRVEILSFKKFTKFQIVF